jgi:hypothetical protein
MARPLYFNKANAKAHGRPVKRRRPSRIVSLEPIDDQPSASQAA